MNCSTYFYSLLFSQIPIDKWHDLIGDSTYADAILDSIVHNARRIDRCARSRPSLASSLREIDDWNCSGASVGHVEGGILPQTPLSGRNLAKARQQGSNDVLMPCAACYLNTHGVNEKIKNDVRTRQRVNEALEAADLKYDGDRNARHACEALVNNVGLDKIKEQVNNPLTGLKVAG
jgi:heterodisulfide reductase subunit B